jgi:CheY-like chemotaxis protein
MATPDGRRILVVDDNDGVRQLLRRLVETWGYACDEASSGVTALARLATRDFALILTDYDMPDGDGLMLIRAVMRRARDGRGRPTPIILVSGSATDDLCDQAVAAGADAVFYKPFELAYLRATVDRFAGGAPPPAA